MIAVEVPSSNENLDPYTVGYNGEWWTCTCAHWVFRLKKSKGRCKHIEAVIAKAKEMNKKAAEYQIALAQIEEEFANIEW